MAGSRFWMQPTLSKLTAVRGEQTPQADAIARLRQVSITGVEQTEEAKPVNLGPQIAKAHVTSPQKDFV